MANNTNTQQTRSSQDNIKNVKTNVISPARAVQQNAAEIRRQLDALNEIIARKQAEFYSKAVEAAEEEAAVVEETETAFVPTVEEEVAAQTEETAAEADVIPAETEAQPQKVVEEVKAADNNSAAADQTASVAAAQQPVQSGTRIVTTTTENGREVKTYTDEKGNVRVRKFLDTTPRKPAVSVQRSPSQQRTQGAGARPAGQGGGRYDGRRPAPQTKDGQTDRRPAKPGPVKRFAAPPVTVRPEPQKSFGNKNKTREHTDEKRAAGIKKNLMTRDYSADYDEDRVVRKARGKKSDNRVAAMPKITYAEVSLQEVPIKMLSERIGVTASEIIKQLFKEGIMKTINDTVDFDYAAYIAGVYGVTLELKMDKTAEEIISQAEEDDGLENDTKRPPIVTVMGHVDHGKTSLLDAIRNTNVTGGEAGGITQHIGAYTVTAKGQPITFIDTPGHAAFTAMRARGAKITDVAIIVVAADDGVMPQTLEAINHAKAADVSIIVAINKMDKPDINVDRVKQQLAEHELLAEDWGGDVIMVPVSAKTGMGLDSLLESVLLVTEIKELKANPDKRATGNVIEAKLDKGRGPVATILVSNGTLHVGDSVIAGFATGKIRAMFDDKGKKVKSAGPSVPVEVLGFSEVPDAGDYMYVADEKLVKKAAEERKNKLKLESARQTPSMNLGDLFGRISEGQLKTLNLIIKTDVQGSLEALKSSLEKISNDEVKVCPIHGGVGAINETDIMLAKASDAIIIGFNVRADSNAKSVAEKEGVDIRLYSVIYDAVDDITAAMKGLLAPKFKETVLGTVEVREVFRITGVGTVAGGYVTAGKAVRNGKVRVYRNDVSVYDGNILALKRFKDDVKEVAAGYECGISVENYNDIKTGDIFEIYQMEEIRQ